MHQCDSDDLDDKFSTSMVWNMPSKTQTPSLVHIMDAWVIATAMGSHDIFMTYFNCNSFS